MFFTAAATIAAADLNNAHRRSTLVLFHDVDLDEDVNNDKKANKLKKLLSDISFVAFFVYFWWLWIGILWYKFYDRFTLATAFFYSLDAGLSVGFCSPGYYHMIS